MWVVLGGVCVVVFCVAQWCGVLCMVIVGEMWWGVYDAEMLRVVVFMVLHCGPVALGGVVCLMTLALWWVRTV